LLVPYAGFVVLKIKQELTNNCFVATVSTETVMTYSQGRAWGVGGVANGASKERKN